MNKCEHNLAIDQFCIYQHCECKQSGGCYQCIKKYHNHNTQLKIVSQPQLTQYIKTFLNTQTSHKPNCRNIQDAFYTYFNQIKTEFTHIIDLLCKTVVNSVGAPYLMHNKLFNCFKKIKNKQYKKLHQKDVTKFCQMVKATSTNAVIKEESKLYKEQLKKFSKLVHNIESIMISYEDLSNQINLSLFKHDKSNFQNLSSILKQTQQTTDPINLISQINRNLSEKNSNEKSQRAQNNSSPLKSYSSHQYEKIKQKQIQTSIPSFYSGGLPIKSLEQKTFRTEKSFVKNQLKKEQLIQNNQLGDPHKFCVRDLKQLDKKQNVQNLNVVKPSSIQKNLNSTKYKVPITQIYPTGININPVRNLKFDDCQQVSSPTRDKQRVSLLYHNERKPNSGAKDDLGTQASPTFFDSEELKKTECLLQTRQKRQLTLKEAEINSRKEKLIQMMKSHKFTKNSPDPLQNKQNAKRNNTSNVMAMDNWKKQLKQPKNTLVLANTLNDRLERSQKQEKMKRNFSELVESKRQKFFAATETKPISKEPNCTALNNFQMDNINPISECSSDTISQKSLEEIKQHLHVNNMNTDQKPNTDQKEDKANAFRYSRRMILVPQTSIETAADSPLIKKRKVLLNPSPEKFEIKIDQKSTGKSLRKSSNCSQDSQKQQMTESQQRSLSLLIKSIHKKSQEAILLLENALKESPNNLSAAELLSYLYLESQKPKEALVVCNKVLQKFEVVKKQNEELLINLQINKGAALNMLGRYSQTIALLTRCIKIKQTDRMLKNLADAYYFSSNYQKAISFYQKALRMSPKYDEAYHNLAVCFYLQENYKGANNALQKALQLAPKNAQYVEFHSHLLRKISI